MKSIIILTLLFPVLLIGQDIATETGSTQDKLSMNSIPFSNQDGEPYSTNWGQPSSSPSAIMMENLDNMVVEFAPSSGIVGDANGQGINNGIFIIACYEGVNSEITVGSGMPISSVGIATRDMSFTRYIDGYSAKFRSLMILETVIPYIEVNYLREFPNGFIKEQIIRFEDCIISSYSGGGSSGENQFTENITFDYTKACYKSFELDDTGVTLFETEACLDKTIADQSTCVCGPF